MSNFSEFHQGSSGTFVENLFVDSINFTSAGGDGEVTGFAYNSTTTAATNIANWPFNGYVLRVGNYATVTFDSPPLTPSVGGTPCTFRIPYPTDANPVNVNATTAFGLCTFSGTSQSVGGSCISSDVGQHYISCSFVPLSSSAGTIHGHFTMNLN